MRKIVFSLVVLVFILSLTSFSTAYTLSGTIKYNGHPMFNYTSIQPVLIVTDLDTSQTVQTATVSYSTSTSAYQVQNLEGNVVITTYFHIQGPTHTFPGNYRADSYFYGPQAGTYDIEMRYIIRMYAPCDNTDYIQWTPPYPSHDAPITVTWETVGGATKYSLAVYVYRDEDHPEGWGILRMLVYRELGSTTCSVNLPTSRPQEHYQLNLYAYDNGKQLGSVWITYPSGYGWDYRFKAVAKTTLVPALDLLLEE